MNRKIFWVMDNSHNQIMGSASTLGEQKTIPWPFLTHYGVSLRKGTALLQSHIPIMSRLRLQKFLSAQKCTLEPDWTITSAAAGISCRYRRVHKFEAAGHVGKLQIWQKRYCRTAGE